MDKISAEERRQIIDRFGEADRLARLWVPSVNPHEARRAELLAIIQSWYADADAEFSATEDGEYYRLEVTQRQFSRDLTPQSQKLAFEALRKLTIADAQGKVQKFNPFQVFSTTQYAIKRYLGEEFLERIAPRKRVGCRKYNAVALEGPAQFQKAA